MILITNTVMAQCKKEKNNTKLIDKTVLILKSLTLLLGTTAIIVFDNGVNISLHDQKFLISKFFC